MGKRKGRKGSSKRAAKKGLPPGESEEVIKAPHSFVINRGRLGKNGNELLLNIRKIMEPFTASHLKVKKQNVLKDFVHIAGPLNVSHLILLTKSPKAMYLRIAKLPHGPTLTFQIKEYALMRDIVSSQKKSIMYEKMFEYHPLLVLNNFSGEGMYFKLMATTFQNMFPSINVNKTNLNNVRRTLLLNYNEDKTIELRQYAIKVIPTGMSKAVKKLIQSKVPDLSRYEDIGDFLQKSGNLSESEVEMDTPANTVVLPQSISTRGNIAAEKSAIRLYEIGPRLKLQLIKIEEGLLTGEVLYHEFIKRTPEEIKALKEKLKAKELLKQQRREQQQRNVERKKAATESANVEDDDGGDDREEDRKWYREEVGEEPDESLLPVPTKRKRDQPPQRKRMKTEEKKNSNYANKKKVSFARDQKKIESKGNAKNQKKGKVLKYSAKLSNKNMQKKQRVKKKQ